MRISLFAVAFLSITLVAACGPAPVCLHCAVDEGLMATLEPTGNGPAHLAEVYCLEGPETGNLIGRFVSPDAARVARVLNDYAVQVSNPLGQPWRVWADDVARGDSLAAGADSVRWGASGVLWAALQRRADSSGFAGEPVLVSRLNGTTAQEILLIEAPGRLDRVQWIGDGFAIVEFDSRGDSYRPERPNPTPTLAMLDARQGRVVDSIPWQRMSALRGGGRPDWRANRLLGTVLDDGRMRVVVPGAGWVVWTQGEAPRVVPSPYETGASALTPEGRAVLTTGMINAFGASCEHYESCPEPIPVEGVWAALQDLESGRTLWEMRGVAENFKRGEPPVVSPDGRYALMELPPSGRWRGLGLVSVRDGTVLQQFASPESYGFTADGLSLWLEYGVFALYRLVSSDAP
jgi:hypothetical protein